ncbi:ABC transporter permease [Streptomyces cinereospinus]|uniref:Transport permease protein n=1 Tax=Streptomyces cinereospinus TaxID=285561 RepID=A0ABV5MYQ4_9ACTN
MTTTLPQAPPPAAPTPGRAPVEHPLLDGVRPGGARTFGTEVLAVLGRRLRRLRRGPGRAIGVVLNPLVSMVLLGYLFRDAITLPAGGSYVEYVFAGGAVQVGLACVGPTAVSMAMDLQGGIIDRFRSLPISRSAVPLGHTGADFLVALAALAVTTGAGLLLGWRSHTGLLPTLAGFALVAVFTYVMLWLGVLLAVTLRSVETISVVAPFIVVVLPFLSSAFLSPQSMPGAVRPIAEWNPVSAVIAACRDLWGNPATTSPGFVGRHPLIVVAVTLSVLFAACLALSLRRFRKP